MSAMLERRLEALEARQHAKEVVTIIRIIALPRHSIEEPGDDEPGSAEVGGKLIQRAANETSEAFMARVEAEAKLAAKPGCVAVALVWPISESSGEGL